MTERINLDAVTRLIERRVLTDTVEIYRSGEAVLDPVSGEYVPGPETVVYEGQGAVSAGGGGSTVLHLDGQPYTDDTASPYRLLTPLSAPLASREDRVRVTESADPGLVGRTWRVTDLSQAGSLPVVRITWLDQDTQITDD